MSPYLTNTTKSPMTSTHSTLIVPVPFPPSRLKRPIFPIPTFSIIPAAISRYPTTLMPTFHPQQDEEYKRSWKQSKRWLGI